MVKIIISLIMIACCAPNVTAEVLFSDNFDSNCTGTACSSQGCSSSYPTGWDGWYCQDSQPATVDGETKYAGEISTPGRGGAGKSLKTWRANGYWGNYVGVLGKSFSGGPSDFWFRYYQKIPTAFQYTGSSGFKLWRFNTSGGSTELHLNVTCTSNCMNDGKLSIGDTLTAWQTIADHSELASIWDGEWHCLQFHIDLTTATITLYIDGVLTGSVTGFNISGTITLLQHMPIGNSNDDHTWISQESWQAWETDDIIIATTKAETDPDDAEPTPVRKLNNVTGVRVTLH